jgi:hypothetical protein
LLRNAQTATLFNYTEADQRLDRLNAIDPRNVGGLNRQEQQAKEANIQACRGAEHCITDVNKRYDRLVSDRAETTITAINAMKAFDQCAPGDTTCAAGSLVQLQAVRADMKARGMTTDQTELIGLNSYVARAASATGDTSALMQGAGAAAVGAMASNAGNAGTQALNHGVKPDARLVDDILGLIRSGSGLKDDPMHRAASFLSKEQLADGIAFSIRGGDGVDRTLLQTVGKFNGSDGIFEYIVDPSKGITHQRFIKNGSITGIPNQRVARP